jgi:hypothetical protein
VRAGTPDSDQFLHAKHRSLLDKPCLSGRLALRRFADFSHRARVRSDFVPARADNSDSIVFQVMNLAD